MFILKSWTLQDGNHFSIAEGTKKKPLCTLKNKKLRYAAIEINDFRIANYETIFIGTVKLNSLSFVKNIFIDFISG